MRVLDLVEFLAGLPDQEENVCVSSARGVSDLEYVTRVRFNMGDDSTFVLLSADDPEDEGFDLVE